MPLRWKNGVTFRNEQKYIKSWPLPNHSFPNTTTMENEDTFNNNHTYIKLWPVTQHCAASPSPTT
eukprot:15462499-Alexandrium_andersonii.AAC.1